VLRVQDLQPPADINRVQADARIDILQQIEREFVARHPGSSPASHQTAYDRAVRLMRTTAQHAFNLNEEPRRLRDATAVTSSARAACWPAGLVERGVPFIEVNLGFSAGSPGWDTHQQNFNAVRQLSGILDPAWGTLMKDLKQRGLLESTLIVWMGEFGRTPRINPQQGRDHYPNAWSAVMAGGGIRGGQVVGRTSADGTTVEAAPPTNVPDFLGTVVRALGIDHRRQNMSNVQRPIRLVDLNARPVESVLQ